MNKREIKLDKPIINGFMILELSKYIMYDFYYNVLKKRYGDKLKLLFTDTEDIFRQNIRKIISCTVQKTKL